MLPWFKVSTSIHTHPKVRLAGADAREIFMFLLARNAEVGLDGFIPGHYVDPDYLADALQRSVTDVTEGLSRALRRNLVVKHSCEHGDGLLICGWSDEWRPPLSNADRQRKYRESQKAKPNSNATVVTLCNAVTENNGSNAIEEKRIDKKRREKKTHIPPAGEARRVAGKFVEYFNRDFDRQFKGEHYVEDVRKVLKKKYKEHQLYAVIWYANTAWEKDEVRANVSPSTLLRLSAPRGKSSDSCFGGYFRAAEELWPRLNANEEPFWRKEAGQ